MKRSITYPPFYFFCCMVLTIISYFLFPISIILEFPVNLAGTIPLITGYIILRKASDLFHSNNTTFNLEVPSVFVIKELFRYSRNPMYLGALIFLTGLSLLLGNLTGLLFPFLFFLAINFLCIPAEEKLMKQTFGKRYLIYKKKVRRWI